MLSRQLFTALANRTLCVRGRYLSAKAALSDDDYEKLANETLDKLADYLDSFPDRFSCDKEYDVNSSMGVVTAKISSKTGTYVINKQTPNRQIWFSSPISGPKRFDLINKKWISTRENMSLGTVLNNEFRRIFQTDEIDFCKHL